MTGRERRRHDRWRMVRRARAVIAIRDGWGLTAPRSPALIPRIVSKHEAQRLADNMATCRAVGCCGHRIRLVEGPPLRERRQALRETDAYDDAEKMQWTCRGWMPDPDVAEAV